MQNKFLLLSPSFFLNDQASNRAISTSQEPVEDNLIAYQEPEPNSNDVIHYFGPVEEEESMSLKMQDEINYLLSLLQDQPFLRESQVQLQPTNNLLGSLEDNDQPIALPFLEPSQGVFDLSQILSKSFKNPNEDFIYQLTPQGLNRIYCCQFCDLLFEKACSLGGHISRAHPVVNQNQILQKQNAIATIKKSIKKIR